MFILDYHDVYMPFVNGINALRGKTYASRTILFHMKHGALMPIAIELTLPPKEEGDKAISRVFTSNTVVYPEWLWCLAKTHVSVIDSGFHQLVSHW